MSIDSILISLAATLVFGSALGSEPAAAQNSTANFDRISVHVPYSDLNLASEAGASIMLRRIRNAAKDICGPQPDDVLHYGAQYDACVKAITDRSVASFNNPMVTAMNGGRGEASATQVVSIRH